MGGYDPVTSEPVTDVPVINDIVTSGRFRLHCFDVLHSTQTEAEKPSYGAGDIIIAALQTGSYGRRGRAWQAPAGNLYYTMIEDFTGLPQLEYLPYVVGLALYDAVIPLLRNADLIRLKWPNDILIEGKKLSGILIEMQENRLLIGVGVNVALVPETDQPVTCINDYALTTVNPQQLLQDFLLCYEKWNTQARQGGFLAIRDIWLSRAAFKDEIIHARLANGQVLTGYFEEIDARGALVLREEKAHHIITSADIFFAHSDIGNKKTNNE